ncbi:hypothetical protein ACSBM8_08695 [Sphingomonas sp. ASY06-1R]|jgi:hypothetical protein|uniref:hypothetical protein n=1 Tax=Sphingomonas sp. ASY06-1R TaxID=3445771 RepID=UPI003FA2C5A8
MLGIASTVLFTLSQGPVAEQASACPFLPQYRGLQAAIDKAPAASALRSLYRYARDPANDNPVACEAIELDRQIAERERTLIAVISPAGWRLPPTAIFHCATPDTKTTRCDGIVADGTAQPDAIRIRPPSPITAPVTARLSNSLPDARLIGLYHTTLADVVAARPVKRLKAANMIRLMPGSGDRLLIALFTAPAPYKVRKFVWYY